ncbi:MAG TPA: hypothetical protein PLS63_11465 [Microthrixaceae bacterium]|nr:hypothetical protein [Microthrixaceae bacterium]
MSVQPHIADGYRTGRLPHTAYLGTGRNRSYWLPIAARPEPEASES